MQEELMRQVKGQAMLLEHMALMVDSMTKLIVKYEMVIDKYSCVLGSLQRIEHKIDNLLLVVEEK